LTAMHAPLAATTSTPCAAATEELNNTSPCYCASCHNSSNYSAAHLICCSSPKCSAYAWTYACTAWLLGRPPAAASCDRFAGHGNSANS
jgi:hypothetical protein